MQPMTDTKRWCLLIASLASLTAVSHAAGAEEWRGRALFTPADAAEARLAPGPEVSRSRTVTVDVRALPTEADLALRGPAEMSLPLFDDIVLPIRLTKSAPGVPGAESNARVLLGEIVGKPHSFVWLSVNGEVMVGDISAPGFGDFQVRVAGPGVHSVREIDPFRLNPCGTGPMQSMRDARQVEPNPEPAFDPDAGDERTNGAGTGPVIDMLIAWTPVARQQAGGTAAMQAAIAGWVAATNNYYAVSQIKHTIRARRVLETNYTESASASTDLDRLRNPSDGFMDELQGERDFWGCDLVHLISNSSGVCGIAYIQLSVGPSFESLGFGLTVYTCGSLTFAHEIGHNMGCAHDRQNASSAAYCYSYGWRSTDSLYRTIMSYAPGSRIGYFSDPDIVLNLGGTNYTIGIDGSTCAVDSADNSRTHNNTAPVVAAFRPPRLDTPGAFQSLTPGPGAVAVPVVPTFTWTPSLDAANYEIVVASNAALSTPIVTASVAASSTQYTLTTGPLANGSTFWWRVRAINGAGPTTADGAPWSFKTKFRGDTNNDGTVNFADLANVLASFGQTGPGLSADVNGDNIVNFADLAVVLAEFGLS